MKIDILNKYRYSINVKSQKIIENLYRTAYKDSVFQLLQN